VLFYPTGSTPTPSIHLFVAFDGALSGLIHAVNPQKNKIENANENQNLEKGRRKVKKEKTLLNTQRLRERLEKII